LREYVDAGKLIADSRFPKVEPSRAKWPEQSIYSTLTCAACSRRFVLFVDVDAARGGFDAARM
jgi:hypothetical protein